MSSNFQVGKTRKIENESPTWKVIKEHPNCDWFTNVCIFIYIYIFIQTHLSGVFMGDIERERERHISVYITCTSTVDCPPRHLFRASAEKNILQKENFIKLCQCLWREEMLIPVWWWVKLSNKRCLASWVERKAAIKEAIQILSKIPNHNAARFGTNYPQVSISTSYFERSWKRAQPSKWMQCPIWVVTKPLVICCV